ncbi:hypothetical protein ABZP36_026076 [Zizania latifolia]
MLDAHDGLQGLLAGPTLRHEPQACHDQWSPEAYKNPPVLSLSPPLLLIFHFQDFELKNLHPAGDQPSMLSLQGARGPSYGWSWEEKAGLVVSLLDDALFQVLYAAEAVVLSAALCSFFLCCGCHI